MSGKSARPTLLSRFYLRAGNSKLGFLGRSKKTEMPIKEKPVEGEAEEIMVSKKELEKGKRKKKRGQPKNK